MTREAATTAKAVVLRPAEIRARQRGGGAKTFPLVTRLIGSTSSINGITNFGTDAAIPLHFHNCEEGVQMLEGEAIAEIGGVERPVKAGDTRSIDDEHEAPIAS